VLPVVPSVLELMGEIPIIATSRYARNLTKVFDHVAEIVFFTHGVNEKVALTRREDYFFSPLSVLRIGSF